MALEIYYTGSAEPEGTQAVPSESLGGFVSSSLVPNDVLGNLFSDISKMSLESKTRQTRVIAIRNVADAPLTGLKVYTNCDEASQAGFQVGYQVPQIGGDCPGLCSEKLSSGSAIPQRVTLDEAEGNPDALTLPDLDRGAYLFIFISRTITADLPSYTYEDLLEQEDDPLAQSETAELTFRWD